MKNIKLYFTLFVIVLIAVLGISLYITVKSNHQLKADNEAWKSNLFNELNEQNKQFTLQTQEQFEAYFPRLDSIAKANGVTKHITEVHSTEVHYKIDTVVDTLIQPNDSVQFFTFAVDTNCFKLAGAIDVPTKHIEFHTVKLDDEINTFYYFERGRVFGWKWTPKWGKKQYEVKTVSECTKDVKSTRIRIDKKSDKQ